MSSAVEYYRYWDKNNDGALSKEEFKGLFDNLKANNLVDADDTLENAFHEIDKSESSLRNILHLFPLSFSLSLSLLTLLSLLSTSRIGSDKVQRLRDLDGLDCRIDRRTFL